MAEFIQSASDWRQLPDHSMPEIAFAGRSNVGKSSLIGSIFKRKNLVRSSRTPGRTQLLNLFEFQSKLMVVDLPGYGYAKLSKTKRAALEDMVKTYIEQSTHLQGVVLLIDARRDPISPYDKFIADWIVTCQRPLLVCITKSDLIPKNHLQQRVKVIENQLDIPRHSAVLCSAHKGIGRQELVAKMYELANLEKE